MTIVSTLGKLALTAALGVAVTGTALTATSAPAEARRIIIVKHKPFHVHRFHRPFIYSTNLAYGHSCYFFKKTGQWAKYRACLGHY